MLSVNIYLSINLSLDLPLFLDIYIYKYNFTYIHIWYIYLSKKYFFYLYISIYLSIFLPIYPGTSVKISYYTTSSLSFASSRKKKSWTKRTCNFNFFSQPKESIARVVVISISENVPNFFLEVFEIFTSLNNFANIYELSVSL